MKESSLKPVHFLFLSGFRWLERATKVQQLYCKDKRIYEVKRVN